MVKNTRATPARQAQLEAAEAAARWQAVKIADFTWGSDLFVSLGYPPEIAYESILNAQHHFGKDQTAFYQWVQNAPQYNSPMTKANQYQADVSHLQLWASDVLEKKGYSRTDATAMFNNLLAGAEGNLQQVKDAVNGMKLTESEQAKQVPGKLSEDQHNASRARDIKNLAVLGLDKDATPQMAKKSYFRLSKQFHPDKNPEGAEKFKEIAKAYEELSDSSTFTA